MYKIVFLDHKTLGPAPPIIQPDFAHIWRTYETTTEQQLLEHTKGADILITNKVVLNAATLKRLPTLKLIVVAATGTNVVDSRAAAQCGITVCNIRGYALPSAAEHTLALILALRRNLMAYREDILAGEWQRSGQFCFFNGPLGDLRGKTLGLIGTGIIAQHVAQLGKAFGMQPVFHSVSGRESLTMASGKAACLLPLPALLQQADVVSLHCPLTPDSHQLLNTETFALMKPDALLINTARGDIVDMKALQQALNTGAIAGAGLDVLPEEPPQAGSIAMQLAAYRNVIITPHTAWASREAIEQLTTQLVTVLEKFIEGNPINTVTA